MTTGVGSTIYTMLVLTVTSHALEGLPGPPESPILIMITGELDKRTESLFFCTREVTYELRALSYGFDIRGQGWSHGLLDDGRCFFFDIRSTGDIRIFRLYF
jgi:hypothetical protein